MEKTLVKTQFDTYHESREKEISNRLNDAIERYNTGGITEEQYLREHLAMLHQKYLNDAQPYIQRLASIMSMRCGPWEMQLERGAITLLAPSEQGGRNE